MKSTDILSYIDHTALKAVLTWQEIEKLCTESLAYHTATACLPPSYVKRAVVEFPQLVVCTVIGFPLGYSTTDVKVREAVEALADGAGEIDMVINLGHLKDGCYNLVTEEIAAVKAVCGSKLLKVIVEACYLSEDEKIQVCRCVAQGGGDYLKTSTGFGSGGATLSDIELFKKYLPAKVKIKAAGGINTVEDMENFIRAGADRLGTSKGVSLLK